MLVGKPESAGQMWTDFLERRNILANENRSHYNISHVDCRATNLPMIKNGTLISTDPAPGITAGNNHPRPAAVTSIDSETLLGERGEVKIQHGGEQYSLRRTRQGKLILTK